MTTSSYFIADSTFNSTYAPSDSTSSFVQVVGTTLNITDSRTPSSSSDTGTKGEICWDSDYLYVCWDSNSWKRVQITNVLW